MKAHFPVVNQKQFLTFYFIAITDSSQMDNTAAVIGGVVVAVVFIITIGTVIVIVVLVLRYRRGDYSTGTQQRYVLCVHNTYYEL